MGKCSVFIIHHGAENYPALYNTIATPILGGSDKDVGDFGSRIIQRETSGDTICKDHHLLSEFTVYYWIWKNVIPTQKPEYVGIFHYRTFLNLGGSDSAADFLNRMGITEGNITEKLQKCDAIITDVSMEAWYSSDWLGRKLTIIKQYNENHKLGDLLFQKTIDFLTNDAPKIKFFKSYPNMDSFAKKYFSMTFNDSKDLKPYFKSVFVSTVKYFNEYMQYLFAVLNNLMANEDIQKELATLNDDQKYRLLAFFGERLTALFIAYCKINKKFVFEEVQRYHEEDLEKFLKNVYPSQTINGQNAIPLVRFYSDTNKLYAYRPVSKAGWTWDKLSTKDLKTEKFWVDRMVGYLLTGKGNGIKPVYMLQEPKGKDYFYTTDEKEYKDAISNSGYTENFHEIGNIFTKETSSCVARPMVRYLYNAKDRTRHFYTLCTEEAAEFGKLLGVEGVEEGVLGYIICVDQKKPIILDN